MFTLDSHGYLYINMAARLITCADGTLCCADQNSAQQCCAGGKGLVIEDGRAVTPQSSAPTSSSITRPSASVVQTMSLSLSVSPTVSSAAILTPRPASSNTGSIAGGAVGGCAGVVVLAFVFWYLIKRQYMKKPNTPPNNGSYQVGEEETWQVPNEVPAREIRRELDPTQTREELDSAQTRQELDI